MDFILCAFGTGAGWGRQRSCRASLLLHVTSFSSPLAPSGSQNYLNSWWLCSCLSTSETTLHLVG